MQINYQLEMEKIISSLEGVPSLLLHVCCAPCSSYTLQLLAQYFKITIIYYNPNISPYEEYLKRKEELLKIIDLPNYKYPVSLMDCTYDNIYYEAKIKGLENEVEGGSRCKICYRMRLEKTAQMAKMEKFDYFTTSLSISPYKNAKLLNEIGEKLEKEYGVKYLYADLKKKNGYKRSIELSKIYDLYRQDYCGCIYSKILREK